MPVIVDGLGVALGATVYGGAFLVRSPQSLCQNVELPLPEEIGSNLVPVVTEGVRTPSPIVGATCRAVMLDGSRDEVSLHVIDWPANLVALAGIVIIAIALVHWSRNLRRRREDDERERAAEDGSRRGEPPSEPGSAGDARA
ncbi:hypothetical protein [Rhodococcus sp. HNM0569]|uniref:hypothetical protein n=1 Tax=Rhodococcus sp. HNM0569 TaxID=2716340 RepID=UPI00146BFD3A|nr:hypothetical protein [Rhodococcus sp. HNM0569]NLU84934.1 hypothetical protein [Rhodococcus sp. HNM0569]